ncbi:MAG TPA: HipA domain-containing protein [Solirubrobacteraceae bacterium]|nr:HipA domain-containing protein [Solirubrobacteraceae bacterium]
MLAGVLAGGANASEDQLDQEVADLPDGPLALHDDSELSLAGLQNKMLLVRLSDGRWAWIRMRIGAHQIRAAWGPSFALIAGLLSATADDPPSELDRLVQMMTFNLLIGNADAHGKNISVLHDPLGTVRLAPLYDTAPTLLWPQRYSAARSLEFESQNNRYGADPVRLRPIVREQL